MQREDDSLKWITHMVKSKTCCLSNLTVITLATLGYKLEHIITKSNNIPQLQLQAYLINCCINRCHDNDEMKIS